MPNSRKAKGEPREVEISKSLSYLLRHGAKIERIALDEAGWANVADVVGLEFLSLFSFAVQNMWCFC